MGKLYEFYDKLAAAYDKDELVFENNFDRGHNAAVMLLMLRKSKRISMVCGSMSVFRKSFYRYIREDYPADGERMEEEIRESLRSFISRSDTKLRIILENPTGKEFDEFLIPIEEFCQNAEIYKLKWDRDMPELGHFSFTEDEKIVRLENNKETHEALIKIGNWDKEEKAAPLFDKLILQSEAV